MRPVYTALLALGLTIVTAAAQAATNDRIAEVDAIFASWDKPNSPGCALGVIKDGTLTYARGYGLANLEHGVPITALTVFDIGSCSKQFTAFSVLLLAQREKLSLDDDIRKLVPEIPDYGTRITLRHLLHHTSGLRDYNDLLEMDGKHVEDLTTDDDALRLLAKQRALNFNPGDRQLYSNTGYFLLAIVVKRATGQSLREFAHENIFVPLGMTNTHFHDDHTLIVPARATAYGPRAEGGFKIDMSNWEQLGDGAVMTTVEDLLKWDQNFYEAKVGERTLLALMQTPGQLNSGQVLNYACGLVVGEYGGSPMIHHGGAWAGYRAELMRFPDQHLSVVVLANLGSMDVFDLAGRVALLHLETKSPQPAKPVADTERTKPETPREAEQFAGTYRYADGQIGKVVWKEDHLVFVVGGTERELEPVSERSFVIRNAARPPVTFSLNSKTRIKEMVIKRPERPPDILQGVEDVSPKLKLSDYIGAYRSDELNAAYTLRQNGDRLTVQVGQGTEYPLSAAFADGFTTDNGASLAFSRNKRGRVTGFVFGRPRAYGMIFERAK